MLWHVTSVPFPNVRTGSVAAVVPDEAYCHCLSFAVACLLWTAYPVFTHHYVHLAL